MSFKELEDVTNKFSEQYGENIFGAIYKVQITPSIPNYKTFWLF